MSTLTHEERQTLEDVVRSDPVSWMEDNFYIEDPRDPYTGDLLPPGPIQLHPIQKRILRAALLKVDGRFPYSTVVYSTIKKSGKTRIGAAVAAWFADTQRPYNEIYCLANDGKQSTDRILSALKKCIKLNPAMRDWKVTKSRIELPNGTFIEAIPCDPTGSAGANPGLTVWSEMWGYQHQHKERLWTEMTVPPTKYGQALRWVESYAGYKGESNVLYDLYTLGVDDGARHWEFPDLPVNVNKAAGMMCYWDEGDRARRMPWQTEAYYAQEASVLVSAEFDRIHRNIWMDPLDKAIAIEWWDACEGRVPKLDARTPVVLSLDAAVSYDCCACVLLSRHPDSPKDSTMIRGVRIYAPPRGGTIDLTGTVQKTLYEWKEKYNIVEVAYDKFQLAQMMQDARRKGIKVFQFEQGQDRCIADKLLLDTIISKRLTHNGHSALREHVDNAAAKTVGERLRFVKPLEDKTTASHVSRKKRPIDGLVATSMGNRRCLHLNLGPA